MIPEVEDLEKFLDDISIDDLAADIESKEPVKEEVIPDVIENTAEVVDDYVPGAYIPKDNEDDSEEEKKEDEVKQKSEEAVEYKKASYVPKDFTDKNHPITGILMIVCAIVIGTFCVLSSWWLLKQLGGFLLSQ